MLFAIPLVTVFLIKRQAILTTVFGRDKLVVSCIIFFGKAIFLRAVSRSIVPGQQCDSGTPAGRAIAFLELFQIQVSDNLDQTAFLYLGINDALGFFSKEQAFVVVRAVVFTLAFVDSQAELNKFGVSSVLAGLQLQICSDAACGNDCYGGVHNSCLLSDISVCAVIVICQRHIWK